MWWWIVTGIIALLLLPIVPFVMLVWVLCLFVKVFLWCLDQEDDANARVWQRHEAMIRQAIKDGR